MVEVNIENGMGGPEALYEDTEPEAWPEPVSNFEPVGTPLFELKNRREKIASELVKSFQVPRWEDPEIFCDFSVIEPSVLSKALQRREKQKNKKDDWVAWAYCDVLAPACKQVFAVMNEDHSTKYSLRKNDPTGAPTKVDHDLAKALGLDPGEVSASETFRKLFFSEGDVLEFANRVFRWSSIVGDEADEAF